MIGQPQFRSVVSIGGRGAGKVFLDWIAPARGARWLDVGCGTGSFTELIVNMRSPAQVFAIDPEQSQIDHARNGPMADRAHFKVGDAEALPFADGTFDIVVSGLVLNFIPDAARALLEMRRVGCEISLLMLCQKPTSWKDLYRREADLMGCRLADEKCQSRHDHCYDTIADVAVVDAVAGHRLNDRPLVPNRADASCMFSASTLTQHGRRPPRSLSERRRCSQPIPHRN